MAPKYQYPLVNLIWEIHEKTRQTSPFPWFLEEHKDMDEGHNPLAPFPTFTVKCAISSVIRNIARMTQDLAGTCTGKFTILDNCDSVYDHKWDA
jgi:hypothetical protein